MLLVVAVYFSGHLMGLVLDLQNYKNYSKITKRVFYSILTFTEQNVLSNSFFSVHYMIRWVMYKRFLFTNTTDILTIRF